MTKLQIEIFWKEIALIQKRHALFFPDPKKQYIKLQENDTGYNVTLLEGHELPQLIRLEIELAFKLIAGLG